MAKAREALKNRRKELGHTQQSFADLLGVPLTTYRDWEQGVTTPRPGHRPRLARHLMVPLVQLGRWIDGDDAEPAPNGIGVNHVLGHFVSVEQGSGEVWTYESIVVPGLLQTAGYATEVERSGGTDIGEAEVARYVDRRLARQAVLYRQRDPLGLRAVIDESILYRFAGNRDVMAEQLVRLVKESERETVELRVVPFDRGEFGTAFGSFTLFIAQDATDPFMVCIKDRLGFHYLDRKVDVEPHAELFRHLCEVALSPGESLDLIRTVMQERYQ
jgi:transcriptional regulator with XRE-family HTH domain